MRLFCFCPPFLSSSNQGGAERELFPKNVESLETNTSYLPFRRWLLRLPGHSDITARLVSPLPQHPRPHRSLRRQRAVRACTSAWSDTESGAARRPARGARTLRPRGSPTCSRHVGCQGWDQIFLPVRGRQRTFGRLKLWCSGVGSKKNANGHTTYLCTDGILTMTVPCPHRLLDAGLNYTRLHRSFRSWQHTLALGRTEGGLGAPPYHTHATAVHRLSASMYKNTNNLNTVSMLLLMRWRWCRVRDGHCYRIANCMFSFFVLQLMYTVPLRHDCEAVCNLVGCHIDHENTT